MPDFPTRWRRRRSPRTSPPDALQRTEGCLRPGSQSSRPIRSRALWPGVSRWRGNPRSSAENGCSEGAGAARCRGRTCDPSTGSEAGLSGPGPASAMSHNAANNAPSRRPRSRYAPSRLIPTALAAALTLRLRARTSRKASWRCGVQRLRLRSGPGLRRGLRSRRLIGQPGAAEIQIGKCFSGSRG